MPSPRSDTARAAQPELEGRLLARFVEGDEVLLALPRRPSVRAPLPPELKGRVSPGDSVLVALEGERVVSWRPLDGAADD